MLLLPRANKSVPKTLFQVPEFLDSSFLQVKVSLGSMGALRGLESWVAEAATNSVQETVIGVFSRSWAFSD